MDITNKTLKLKCNTHDAYLDVGKAVSEDGFLNIVLAPIPYPLSDTELIEKLRRTGLFYQEELVNLNNGLSIAEKVEEKETEKNIVFDLSYCDCPRQAEKGARCNFVVEIED